MTNFLLVDFGTAEEAERVAEGLLRRGLVPRTFPQGHPLVDHLRFTVRTADENDRLVAAAREIATTPIRTGGGRRMTTALGSLRDRGIASRAR